MLKPSIEATAKLNLTLRRSHRMRRCTKAMAKQMEDFENADFPRLLPGLEDSLADRLLVVYDGHCGFCNRSVRWFLARDRNDRLRFAPSESPMVAELLNRNGINALAPNTMLVVESPGGQQERVLGRSDGVVLLLRELGGQWRLSAALLQLIPRSARNFGYTVVARLRYRIAGRFDTCPLPTAEERRHFL
jgi:predicted DCC family thiol-disulfide oxidoreductase YuxK